MSHDEKLKEFLKKNEPHGLTAPGGEFENIYQKATGSEINWFSYLLPVLSAAVLVFAVNLSTNVSSEVSGEESLGAFISDQMEYTMSESEFEVGSHYLELIED